MAGARTDEIGEAMLAFTIVAFAAAAYCFGRAVVDLREKRYVWGAIGIVAGAAILLTPIQTQAVKVDLPAR
jgi:hypothetical protein